MNERRLALMEAAYSGDDVAKNAEAFEHEACHHDTCCYASRIASCRAVTRRGHVGTNAEPGLKKESRRLNLIRGQGNADIALRSSSRLYYSVHSIMAGTAQCYKTP